MLCLLPTLLVTPVAYSLLAEAEERGFRKSLAPLLARLRPGFRAEALKGR